MHLSVIFVIELSPSLSLASYFRYLVSLPGQLSLYYEPHCVYNKILLEKERADIVITPVIKQLLPNFTLVSGQEDAVQLAKLLQAKYSIFYSTLSESLKSVLSVRMYENSFLFFTCRFVVPMKNGDLDSKGLLASIIQAEGTIESFKVCDHHLLQRWCKLKLLVKVLGELTLLLCKEETFHFTTGIVCQISN